MTPERMRELCGDVLVESDIHRIWKGIGARRNRSRSWRLGFVVAAALSLVCLLAWFYRPGVTQVPQGALSARSGGEPIFFDNNPTLPAHTVFSDGSEVSVVDGGAVELLANTATAMELHLLHGSVALRVVPNGPRRWLVEAGEARVEVVGTVFDVRRDESEVVVHVSNGTVLVRSRWLPDQVRRVSAGEHLRIELSLDSDPTHSKPPEAEAEPRLDEEVPVATDPVEEAGRDEPSVAGARRLEQALQATDRARAAGDIVRAERILRRALRGASRDPQYSVALYTLAKIRLMGLNRYQDAARSFEQAISAGLPAVLLEDALRLRYEAYELAGDAEGARRSREALEDTHADHGDQEIDREMGMQRGPTKALHER